MKVKSLTSTRDVLYPVFVDGVLAEFKIYLEYLDKYITLYLFKDSIYKSRDSKGNPGSIEHYLIK